MRHYVSPHADMYMTWQNEPSSHNHPSSLIFHPIISVLLKISFITLIKASIAATKWKKMKFGQKKEDGLVMKTEGSKT